VVAEDISDFQIEGISVGDSLLNYMSEEKIKNEIEVNKERYNNNTSFGEVFISKEFLTYKSVRAYVKPNDSKFIIHSISGSKKYKTIDLCIEEKNEILKEFSNLFSNAIKTNKTWNSKNDPTGKSKVYGTKFKFKSGDQINIQCIDIEEQLSIKKNWWSNTLDVGIDRKEIINWFRDY
tara:strand:- start:103 stop:636 length:534 start_codon:yes stop_codon:yes gene_type:complete